MKLPLGVKNRDELEQKLEQDILDNVDINFLFNKGQKLTQGLIDQDRLYNIMTKLKDLAYRQLQQGSKEIDYKEIVKYVKSREGVFAEELLLGQGEAITETDLIVENV